jgi:hypothetical protein
VIIESLNSQGFKKCSHIVSKLKIVAAQIVHEEMIVENDEISMTSCVCH